MHRPVVLCFVDYYLPGFRAGGPTRTIANFVDMLGDEFDIRIVTRDRDYGDDAPYEGVRIDGWNKVGKASVFYASAATLSMKGLRKVLNETEYDAVYLNSFLSPKMTGIPLLLRRLKQVPNQPWSLAPRGVRFSGVGSEGAQEACLFARRESRRALQQSHVASVCVA
jgi:hypothetical protein